MCFCQCCSKSLTVGIKTPPGSGLEVWEVGCSVLRYKCWWKQEHSLLQFQVHTARLQGVSVPQSVQECGRSASEPHRCTVRRDALKSPRMLPSPCVRPHGLTWRRRAPLIHRLRMRLPLTRLCLMAHSLAGNRLSLFLKLGLVLISGLSAVRVLHQKEPPDLSRTNAVFWGECVKQR